MASRSRTGADRSASALGLGYKHWTHNDLSVVLSHYGVRFAAGDSKSTLISSLNRLATQRGLTREDRLTILNAHNDGIRLPSRKPVIRAPTAQSIITQPSVAYPAIAQTEEYSSGASDGSDVEISDDELAEELPSLSEEERDLREYAATMSLPQIRGERRSLGPRSLATVVNRPRLANSPVATIHSAVRDRPAARKRSVPTNHSALLNRSATARTRVPTNARRSGPAAANRARRPTTSPRSRGLAQSQTADNASSTQATSETSSLVRLSEHECIICYNSFDIAKTPMCQPSSYCRHEANVCKPCLSASISSQLDTKIWTRISCPASDCDELLEYRDIQAFADPQIFARYFEFTFQAAQADSHFQRCRTPGCKSGQQCFPEDTIMHCQECHRSTCINCDTEMHHGISCGEKAAERQDTQQSRELATTRYLEKRAKKCPGCNAPTQKTGGCDHVTCKWCGHEYCWFCLADYGPINEEGNEHHAPDCDYHSDNL